MLYDLFYNPLTNNPRKHFFPRLVVAQLPDPLKLLEHGWTVRAVFLPAEIESAISESDPQSN